MTVTGGLEWSAVREALLSGATAEDDHGVRARCMCPVGRNDWQMRRRGLGAWTSVPEGVLAARTGWRLE